MFERFTERARRSLALAQEESRARNHGEIDVGHLLLGALDADRIPGLDAEQVGALRRAAEESLAGQQQRQRRRDGHIPFTTAVQTSLSRAQQIALEMGRTHVLAADLLLGVLEHPPLTGLIGREGLDLPTLGGAISAALPATGGDSAGRSEREDTVVDLLQQIVQRLDTISDQLRAQDR